jgi:hypothetical protein
MDSQQQHLPSEVELAFHNIDYCWHQGQPAFTDAQKSAKKIFTLLVRKYGSLYSNKYILGKMANKLFYLNGMSYWKLKNLLRDEVLSE